MPAPKLLWINDNTALQFQSEWQEILSKFEVISVTRLAAAPAALAGEDIDCALVSGPAPDGAPMRILELLRAADGALPVVFYDLEMTAAEAVNLYRCGAYHCLGFRDSLESLRECLERAIEDRRCQGRARRRFAAAREPWRDFLVGESPAMERVADTIRLVGPRRCTVLIDGESGTGKELAARAIHMASPRAHQNLVAINCSALPEHLLEAELFGHVKGAFTGAVCARVGRFEQAHKGTLFLDEIGDMPIELQAKLLRVLQDREFQRLGSSETIKVDVRVIAASNADLLERVRQGRFREDLYYRLNVVPLHLPALRERDGDVPLLVYHFIKKICQHENVPLRRLAPETLDSLKTCSWPGNVRQLENTVEMAIALSGERDILYPRDLGMAESATPKVVSIDFRTPTAPLSRTVDFDTAVTQYQLAMLQQALSQTGGNKTAAAELLGMKRTTLIMKLKSFEGMASSACLPSLAAGAGL
jgi:DNA-binding NtrC family response regulator